MTEDELFAGLFNKKPVMLKHWMCGEIEYKYISGVIYRAKDDEIDISVELMDKNLNSVATASPEQIRFK